MNILVVGKGGREHALALAASKSSLCDALYCAPGNPGMAQIGCCVPVSDEDIEGLAAFARENQIDLTIVGPESSLAAGIADAFEKAGLRVFGPTQKAARVESDKDYAKSLMKEYKIPTADYKTFEAYQPAAAYVKEKGAPIVIKENGLKAGKGVTVAMSTEEALEALEAAFALEGNKVVVEEYLEGFEFSLIALVCQDLVVPLECAQDHKRVHDGDQGPNTGGMGSYSPVRSITPALIEEAMENVMKPMAKALMEKGTPFTGFLYGGLMVTKDGVKTIEFNARFGDPEAEVILARLESDFIQALLDVMDHKKPQLAWSPKTSHGVVLASRGYPAGSTKGSVIEIDESLDALLYHMGTCLDQGVLKTDGGRVLMAVTLEDSLQQAMEHTYKEAEKIHCKDLFYRKDIGRKDLEEWH